MKEKPYNIQKVYLTLTLLSTLAASFIWGINTLFLLDAGLTNTQAFAANALFTVGEVIFEVPTGIVADTWGRRTSYLLGTLTLAASTLLYLMAWKTKGPFWEWGATSMLLGLGFTFFSGATDAWLVDALETTGFKGNLESVFARGLVISGIAMLVGSVGGGIVAQATNLGVPYVLRAIVLVITFVIAFIFMKDIGFSPTKSKQPLRDIKQIFNTSIELGLKNTGIRWLMVEGFFSAGVSIYAFYAMQPYLLKLYGNSHAYGVAGLAAAIVAGAQIAGGFLVPYIRKLFHLRTSILLTTVCATGLLMITIGFTTNFWVAIVILVFWGLLFAARAPVRQAYLNELIPSKQRATVLSFDSLMSSAGGVGLQPVLGRTADVFGYPTSYMLSGIFQLMAVPFILLTRKNKLQADIIEKK